MGTGICSFSILGIGTVCSFSILGTGTVCSSSILGIEDEQIQDILLIGMGFRNKLRWENGICPPPPFRTLL